MIKHLDKKKISVFIAIPRIARTLIPTTKNYALDIPTEEYSQGSTRASGAMVGSPPGGAAFLITVSSAPSKLCPKLLSRLLLSTSARRFVYGKRKKLVKNYRRTLAAAFCIINYSALWR